MCASAAAAAAGHGPDKFAQGARMGIRKENAVRPCGLKILPMLAISPATRAN